MIYTHVTTIGSKGDPVAPHPLRPPQGIRNWVAKPFAPARTTSHRGKSFTHASFDLRVQCPPEIPEVTRTMFAGTTHLASCAD